MTQLTLQEAGAVYQKNKTAAASTQRGRVPGRRSRQLSFRGKNPEINVEMKQMQAAKNSPKVCCLRVWIFPGCFVFVSQNPETKVKMKQMQDFAAPHSVFDIVNSTRQNKEGHAKSNTSAVGYKDGGNEQLEHARHVSFRKQVCYGCARKILCQPSAAVSVPTKTKDQRLLLLVLLLQKKDGHHFAKTEMCLIKGKGPIMLRKRHETTYLVCRIVVGSSIVWWRTA